MTNTHLAHTNDNTHLNPRTQDLCIWRMAPVLRPTKLRRNRNGYRTYARCADLRIRSGSGPGSGAGSLLALRLSSKMLSWLRLRWRLGYRVFLLTALPVIHSSRPDLPGPFLSPKCVGIGQQPNNCWHLLQRTSNPADQALFRAYYVNHFELTKQDDLDAGTSISVHHANHTHTQRERERERESHGANRPGLCVGLFV